MNKLVEKALREAANEPEAFFLTLCSALEGKKIAIDTDSVAEIVASEDEDGQPDFTGTNLPEEVDEILSAMLDAIKNRDFEAYEAIQDTPNVPGSVIGELEAELIRIAGLE